MQRISEDQKNRYAGIQKKMKDIAIKYRGQYIDLLIEIERSIDYYIANKLTGDEDSANELIVVVLGSLNMKAKSEAFQRTVEKHGSEIEKHEPNLFNSINAAIEMRNRFAHFSVDYSPKAMEDFEKENVLQFVKLKALKPKDNEPHGIVPFYKLTKNTFDQSIAEVEKLKIILHKINGWN